MKIKDRIKIIKQDMSFIFSLKTGKVIESGDKCYQASKWVASIFKFYYYSGMPFYVLLFAFLLLPNFFNSILFTIGITITIYLIIESIIVFIIPISKISCWKTY